MKFNLLINSYITSSGTVSMTVEDMINILSVSGTVNISGNDSVYIDCDLVDRIGIDEIRYYFDSTTNSGTIVSGIFFSYKNDLADGYSNLATNLGNGYYYSNVPSLSAPRYIKMVHTIASGTSISGTIKGFEVLNNDDIVNFGSDGLLESTTVLTSLNYLNYQNYIKEIQIYNNGPSVATAHVFIDPQNNDTDELLSISASEDGPWVFARNVNYVIVNGDNWAAGQYNNTNTSDIADGKLRLDSDKTVGTYTTPIFKNDSVKFAYIDMLQTTISGAIVSVDSDDYTSTLQIRSNSFKPVDYNIYRRLIAVRPGPGHVYFYYVDYLLSTDTVVFNSLIENGDYFDTDNGHGTYSYYKRLAVCSINVKGECFFMHVWCGSAGRGGIEFFMLYNNGLLKATISLIRNYQCGTSYVVYLVDLDSNMNLWVYFYTPNSITLGSAGYWLLHYSGNLTLLYSEHLSSDFIIGCDVAKDSSGALWYTRVNTQAVLKISSTGELLLTYEDVASVGRLCSTNDGGCWFIDDNALYKLDSNGILVDSITNLEINDELAWVMRDESDSNFLWIVDGIYIKLISIDGRIYRSIYLEGFSIQRLYSTKEYLAVFCTEVATSIHYTKIIGRASGGIDKTISEGGIADDIGMNIVSYDNPILGDIIPLSDDPVWNDDLEWNKAVTDNAVLPREEYNQLKLTLRRPSIDIDSPTVENIYYQDNVEITNIPPGQSKTLYLKISLPDGVTIGGDYASNLRVWWELPVV